MNDLTFDPKLIAGLQDQLKTETRAAADERRQAADNRADERQHLAAAVENDRRAAQFRELLRVADPGNARKYADPKGGLDVREFSRRSALIAGARELIDFLEAHPQVPADCLREFHVYPRHGDAIEEEREVDRIAAVLGVPSARTAPNRHYRATRAFGPGGEVTLESVSCARTDLAWKEGDPFPDWWPTEEAAAAAERFAADAQVRVAAP